MSKMKSVIGDLFFFLWEDCKILKLIFTLASIKKLKEKDFYELKCYVIISKPLSKVTLNFLKKCSTP